MRRDACRRRTRRRRRRPGDASKTRLRRATQKFVAEDVDHFLFRPHVAHKYRFGPGSFVSLLHTKTLYDLLPLSRLRSSSWLLYTMFKRVARRQKRKEEEEELGLDEEMKEVMGLQDTDSSESESDSDDDSASGSEGSVEGKQSPSRLSKIKGQKRKRGKESDEEEQDSDLDEGIEGDDVELDGEVDEDDVEEDQDEQEEESGEDDEPTMSISAALQNPLHVVSLDPEIRTCVVCPGKLLKNAKMIEVHMASNVRPFVPLSLPTVSTVLRFWLYR